MLYLGSKVVYHRSFRLVIWKLHQTRPVFFDRMRVMPFT
jgi:hypothetical protein